MYNWNRHKVLNGNTDIAYLPTYTHPHQNDSSVNYGLENALIYIDMHVGNNIFFVMLI